MYKSSPRPMASMILVVLLCGGCSFYRVQAPEHPGVTDHRDVVWSYAWGLLPGSPDVDCNGLTIAEVTFRSNFAFDLLSVISLGLVSPKNVEWKCAGAAPTTGTIPTPGVIPSPASDGGQGR